MLKQTPPPLTLALPTLWQLRHSFPRSPEETASSPATQVLSTYNKPTTSATTSTRHGWPVKTIIVDFAS